MAEINPDRLVATLPRVECDRCNRGVLIEEPYFHCLICNDGNYDICKTCVRLRKHCLDWSHGLYGARFFKNTESAMDKGEPVWIGALTATPSIEPKAPGNIIASFLEEDVDLGSLYKPLDPTKEEIRVLILLPSNFSDDIIVGLRKTALADLGVAYNAVSYMWGDGQLEDEIFATSDIDFAVERNHNIAFAGFYGLQKLKITSHLKQALHTMRMEKGGVRVLWVDQICVNQHDLSERSDQVRLMNRIFQCCTQVVTYLDVTIDPDSPTFKRLDLLHHPAATINVLGDNPTFWDPLRDIFQNPYWGRIWVQQEISCLEKGPVINCRGNVVSSKALKVFQKFLVKKTDTTSSPSWKDLTTVCCETPSIKHLGLMSRFWAHQYKTLVPPSINTEDITWDADHKCETCRQLAKDGSGGFRPGTPNKESSSVARDKAESDVNQAKTKILSILADIEEGDHHVMQILIPSMPGKGPALAWLLGQSRKWQCTDPRDKVYGLLGFVADLEKEDMVIDYKLPVRTVYANAAKMLITKYKSLSFLCQSMLDDHPSSNDLPTWLPDWSDGEDILELAQSKLDLPSTCGSLPCCASFSKDNAVLRVQGVKVDEILDVMPSYYRRCRNEKSAIKKVFHAHSKLPFQDIMVALIQWTETACAAALKAMSEACTTESSEQRISAEWLQHLGSQMWSGLTDSQITALARTLGLVFSSLDGAKTPDKSVTEFQQLIKVIVMNSKIPGAMQPKFDPLEPDQELGESTYGILVANVLAMCRRLFIAKQNNVGMAPPPAQPHDQIWALFGCWSPILLRPHQQGFKVVGDVYLHGIMAGEAVVGFPENVEDGAIYNGFEVRTIDLI